MKILISSDVNEYQISGATNAVYGLRDELEKLGHDVRMLLVSPGRKSYKSGTTYYIGSFPVPVYPTARVSLKTHDKFINELIEWGPDIAHIQSEFSSRILANRIIKTLKIPFVITCHAMYEDYTMYFCPNKKLGKAIIKHYSNKYYNPSKLLIVPSEKLKKVEVEYGVKCPIEVVPNGIRLERYQKRLSAKEKSGLLSKYGLSPSDKILVTVSRMAAEKNIDEILSYMPDLLAKEPNVKLVLVGDGPYRAKLARMVERLNLQNNVIFTGAVAPDEVYKYYQLGEAFVCASTSETQGLTYIEAMASRLPLVCKKDECLNGVLDHKNGFIFDNKDEFIHGVLAIFNDRKLAKKMGKVSFERSNQYGVEEFGKKIEKIYKKVVRQDS